MISCLHQVVYFLLSLYLFLVTSEENQMSFKVDEDPVYVRATSLMYNMWIFWLIKQIKFRFVII